MPPTDGVYLLIECLASLTGLVPATRCLQPIFACAVLAAADGAKPVQLSDGESVEFHRGQRTLARQLAAPPETVEVALHGADVRPFDRLSGPRKRVA